MLRTFLACVLAVVFCCESSAAETRAFEVDAAGAGASGVRFKDPTTNQWVVAPLSGGIATVAYTFSGDDFSEIDVELVGVPYGATKVNMNFTHEGDVMPRLKVGSLQFTADGAKREMIMEGSSDFGSPLQAFASGAGSAFGSEFLAEMVGVAAGRMGVIVGACIGVWFVYMLIKKGLVWAAAAFLGGSGGAAGGVTFMQPEIPGAATYLHRKFGETDADWLVRKHEHRNRFDD